MSGTNQRPEPCPACGGVVYDAGRTWLCGSVHCGWYRVAPAKPLLRTQQPVIAYAVRLTRPDGSHAFNRKTGQGYGWADVITVTALYAREHDAKRNAASMRRLPAVMLGGTLDVVAVRITLADTETNND